MNYYGLLFALIAGMATVLGAALVLFSKKRSEKRLVMILGFAAGMMIILAGFELFQESHEYIAEKIGNNYGYILVLIFMLVGFGITTLLDKLFHHDEDEDELHHVGLITTVAVSMHKLPEGMALYITSFVDINLGIAMALVTAIHHIPEGMMVALPVYYSSNSKAKALIYALCSSLATPLGAIIAMLFFRGSMDPIILGALFGIVTGMFIYIILMELIPTAFEHKQYKAYTIGLLLGLIGMYMVHYLL